MAKCVDFDDVKRRMRYADVAQHYKLQLVVKGDQATGACPVPNQCSLPTKCSVPR